MKGERILLADDMDFVLDSTARGIKKFGENDGHQVVARAASVDEVKALMEGGSKPTVALVDNAFPTEGSGREAAEIIKQFSPDTFIISFSSTSGLKWGQENWLKGMSIKQLVEALTKLQH